MITTIDRNHKWLKLCLVNSKFRFDSNLILNFFSIQFGFPSPATPAAQPKPEKSSEMLQQALAIQHLMLQQQQMHQQILQQQFKDANRTNNSTRESPNSQLAGLAGSIHPLIAAAAQQLPTAPMPQTPTSVSTNHKADSDKSHSPVAPVHIPVDLKNQIDRIKSPFDHSPSKSPKRWVCSPNWTVQWKKLKEVF